MQPPQGDGQQGTPRPGVAERLEPGLRRIVAPNPSPMTFWGTNTYLVGERDLAVIDPGPLLPAHLDAILGSLAEGQRIVAIVVTHSHLDHSPLARPLAAETGAPVLAFGPTGAGQSALMRKLAAEGAIGGGEGRDEAFAPDRTLAHGARLDSPDGDWQLEAIWTPGHMSNHLCLAWGDAIFTGDHVMGWATSLVSPPDGDLTAFMRSCEDLARRPARVFYPGHGAPVTDPAARLAWLVAHRRDRERQILEALRPGPAAAAEIAARIYTDTPPALLPMATRNVLAHLLDLASRGKVAERPVRSGGALAEVPFALI